MNYFPSTKGYLSYIFKIELRFKDIFILKCDFNHNTLYYLIIPSILNPYTIVMSVCGIGKNLDYMATGSLGSSKKFFKNHFFKK